VIASQGMAQKGMAMQSYSVRAKSFTEPFWFKSTAPQGEAAQSGASQGKAIR
jgi:hypothetical protein